MSYNDPLNKVDPLGLRPSEAIDPSSFCPLIVQVTGLSEEACARLVGLSSQDVSNLRDEVEERDCGGTALGCQLVFSRRLTGVLADLGFVLDDLWNLAPDKKQLLSDPGFQSTMREELTVKNTFLTGKQFDDLRDVVVTGVDHDPNEALKRTICQKAGSSLEGVIREKGQEGAITKYLRKRGKSGALACYDVLDVIGANGYTLPQRLADGFRSGPGREPYACIGVHILADLRATVWEWDTTIADMVWESFRCSR